MAKETRHDKVLPQPVKLSKMVSYQRGSIVSRTLVDEEAGSITLFAFDCKQSLSEHTTPYDAIVIALDGEAEVTISGKSLRLKEGELVTMPANKPHALKAVTKFKMMLTMINAPGR